MTTPQEVAAWMLEQLNERRYLYQEPTVYKIKKRFGDEHVYINRNGNLAIDQRVLAEFRKLTRESVVWSRSERMWRVRAKYDPSEGRRTD